ncbi:hypothetical protein ACVIKP_005952 [Rhizobium leguminosarum]
MRGRFCEDATDEDPDGCRQCRKPDHNRRRADAARRSALCAERCNGQMAGRELCRRPGAGDPLGRRFHRARTNDPPARADGLVPRRAERPPVHTCFDGDLRCRAVLCCRRLSAARRCDDLLYGGTDLYRGALAFLSRRKDRLAPLAGCSDRLCRRRHRAASIHGDAVASIALRSCRQLCLCAVSGDEPLSALDQRYTPLW